MPERRHDVEPLAWAASIAILIIDLLLPPGFAVGVLYVGVVLAGLWISRRRFLFRYTFVATGLVLVGLFQSSAGGNWTMAVFNRAASLGALWITAGGIAIYRREAAAREAAEEQLRKQAGLAELGRMAAAVAHEVRNAVAGVGASLDFLARRTSPVTPENVELCRLVRQRLTRLGDAVDDLLAFVEVRPVTATPVMLRALVAEAVELVKGRSEAGDVTLHVAVADLVFAADHDALRRALFNLILNAVQATSPHGEITIRADVYGDRCRFEIVDDGPGIPAAARARLFEPFFSTKTHGVGLGLAFVKRVVLAHGGSVDVRHAPGHGTAVVLELPLEHGGRVSSTL